MSNGYSYMSFDKISKESYICKGQYHASINSPDSVNTGGDHGYIQGDKEGNTERDTDLLTEKTNWRYRRNY